jgi:hypothetical protein
MLHSTRTRKISDSVYTLRFCTSNTWAVTCWVALPPDAWLLISEKILSFFFPPQQTSFRFILRWEHVDLATLTGHEGWEWNWEIPEHLRPLNVQQSQDTRPLHRNVVVVRIVLVYSYRLHHKPNRRQRLCVECAHYNDEHSTWDHSCIFRTWRKANWECYRDRAHTAELWSTIVEGGAARGRGGGRLAVVSVIRFDFPHTKLRATSPFWHSTKWNYDHMTVDVFLRTDIKKILSFHEIRTRSHAGRGALLHVAVPHMTDRGMRWPTDAYHSSGKNWRVM